VASCQNVPIDREPPRKATRLHHSPIAAYTLILTLRRYDNDAGFLLFSIRLGLGELVALVLGWQYEPIKVRDICLTLKPDRDSGLAPLAALHTHAQVT